MAEIKVERNPSEDRLAELGVRDWPIWTKEASEFPWHYDESVATTASGPRVVGALSGGAGKTTVTATISPSRGFSFAVSGITIPPLVCSELSTGRTTTRPFMGRIFMVPSFPFLV